MNAGFSNLSTLKAYLLAAKLRAGTDYDAPITAIGLGVAAAFENYCNRKFARAAGATEIFGADRCQFLLSRYPVESVSLSEFKQDEATGWVAQDSTFIRSIDSAAGIIYLPDQSDPGDYWSQVRFTYTGGFWWNILEPADDGYPTAQPTGATALPADLLEAWLMQCAENWKQKDKLGTGILTEEKVYRISPANLAEAYLPHVKSILGQYIRISMT